MTQWVEDVIELPRVLSSDVLYTFNDRWQVLMEADADEVWNNRRDAMHCVSTGLDVYGNGIDGPLISVNGALHEGKMQNAECKIMGILIAARSVSDTIPAPTGPAIAPLAYYADAEAGWLTERPLFTTKGAKDHEGTAGDEQPIFTTKIMKEAAGMGRPESGKGLSADWGGFTQIDSQAAGFNPLRSSVKSADNDDLPVLPLAGFDPNAIGIEAAEEPNSLAHAKTTRRNGEMAELAGVSEPPVGLSDADATEGRSANFMKKRFLTPFLAGAVKFEWEIDIFYWVGYSGPAAIGLVPALPVCV